MSVIAGRSRTEARQSIPPIEFSFDLSRREILPKLSFLPLPCTYARLNDKRLVNVHIHSHTQLRHLLVARLTQCHACILQRLLIGRVGYLFLVSPSTLCAYDAAKAARSWEEREDWRGVGLDRTYLLHCLEECPGHCALAVVGLA